MSYINYLDLPQVPEELLESVETILAKPRIPTITPMDYFQERQVNDDLIKWCNENIKGIPFDFRAQYQIIGYGLPIHRDKGLPGYKPRTLAINYLLDCGGNNVATRIYDDDCIILESEIIRPKSWHSINVSKLHCVTGLTPGIFRVALTLLPKQDKANTIK